MAKIIAYILLCIKYLPLIILHLIHKDVLLEKDILHYSKYFSCRYNSIFTVAYLLEKVQEFRDVFFLRYKKYSILKNIYKGVGNCYFFMDSASVGGGIMLWHGYSTVVNAISLGTNCEIWQNVTIGKKGTEPIADKPVIEVI